MDGVPSGSQVKKAGSLLRRMLRGDSPLDLEAFNYNLSVIEAHRATYQTPMATANNSLRQMVVRHRIDAKVSQRLKRMQTILDKLTREPTLALNRMQDIGGCRVVTRTRDEVYLLADHVRKSRRKEDKLIDFVDYIARPRASGYRGIHIVAEYGSKPRAVEIQIRTHVMHQWATTVEELSSMAAMNYKQDGFSPLQRYLESMARLLEARELGIEPSPQLLTEYENLYDEALRSLQPAVEEKP